MLGSGRPRDDDPIVLRLPRHEQRDHFLDLAAALLIYLEEGGAVAYVVGLEADDRERVAFLVSRERYRSIVTELRRARDPHVWRWAPYDGLRRG
jgi:hypothetical protein